MKREIIITIICVLLIALWSYAAISKVIEFATFGSQLKRQPLPIWSLKWLQWGLPPLEITIAILINIQKTRKAGLILSSILMTIFTLYVLFALTGAFGEIPCSCAGLISKLGWTGHLVFNTLFTLLSYLGIVLLKYQKQKNYSKQTISI
ncbi:Methylamine utilisation protein MauE [Arachidicoccus rhizosphaerae]|uniref:Methylamine utilisation protein MauE n=1 Tax=Arachidicoccus rhizosphaerae TaxID=551991 RepID=A0A1H4A2W5_9BACT|nr:MauE/DoxX family redox-associated membrane protein [Arachidicoccus rhizosphaerae]SEA30210.1 Methylamine utilisation protein MauE [Arachidicoccus rhizosphaerae]